jgi:pSer/pThr/pTyr-binding forkhead associated (FHA) protein
MPITVILRCGNAEESRLTFDGTQRVVIGRSAGSDVRLPDASVSHRHASLRANGADFILVDEGSTNGTFVGGVRIAPRTSRLVRSGDLVRVGRVWLELRIEQHPVTRDLAMATRDLALFLVSRAMARAGDDRIARLRVVEGIDQEAVLRLEADGHEYLLGRAAHCDLPLSDTDASREHVRVVRRDLEVIVRDLGAKNGTWIAETRLVEGRDTVWRPAQMMRIGRTVVALEEPVNAALAEIESAPDELFGPEDATGAGVNDPPQSAAIPQRMPTNEHPATHVDPRNAKREPGPASRLRRWSVIDVIVMAAALGVLALSLAGLVWLLRS